MNTNSFILMQQQVSSPYLPFSLDEYLDEETILISKDTSQIIPNHIKAQLQKLITYLDLDILVLIQDAGSIREVFNQIKDDLPPSLKEMIQPAAFLEGNGPKFLSAQSRLAAQEAQKNSTATEGQCIQEILSVKKIVDSQRISCRDQ